MSRIEDAIREALNRGRESTGVKKQISVVLDERLIYKADLIVDQFKSITNGQLVTSRNQLIETALEEYIRDAESVLLQDYFINLEEFNTQNQDEAHDQVDGAHGSQDFDLLCCPARNEGFEDVFLGKHQWYSVRIAEWRRPYVKYIACYRGAPYSGITHYAKVKIIKEILGTSKCIVYFDGPPIPLPRTVGLGSSDVMEVRKIRYSSLNLLLNATEVSDLW